MNISNIKPNNPTVVIENQPYGEEVPIDITVDGIILPKKTNTNYDKIKQKSVEEFAEWITRKTVGWGTDEAECSMKSWLEWLKEEVKE